MRVTKLIREYVEKVVCEKMPMPEEPAAMADLRKEFSALGEKLDKMCADAYEKFFRDHQGECAPYYCDDDINDIERIAAYVQKKASVSCGSNTITLAAKRAYDKARHEVTEKRRAAIENILVTLELGGNQADLDAMLANL